MAPQSAGPVAGPFSCLRCLSGSGHVAHDGGTAPVWTHSKQPGRRHPPEDLLAHKGNLLPSTPDEVENEQVIDCREDAATVRTGGRGDLGGVRPDRTAEGRRRAAPLVVAPWRPVRAPVGDRADRRRDRGDRAAAPRVRADQRPAPALHQPVPAHLALAQGRAGAVLLRVHARRSPAMTAIQEAPPQSNSPQGEPDWARCAGCGALHYRKKMARNLGVCPECGHHHRLTAAERIAQLTDDFAPLGLSVRATDVLGFTDAQPYPARLATARAATGLDD